MKDDIARQASIAKDAQENYEREVINHATTSSVQKAIRAELDLLSKKYTDLTSEAEKARLQLSSAESSWESQKYTYEKEIENLTSTTSSISNHNKVLLDQLEVLSAQLANRSDVPPTYSEATTTSEEQLREIISHIRNEKETMAGKYQIALHDMKVVQQKLDQAVAKLDQTKLELEKERARDSERLQLSHDHNLVMAQLNDVNILRESNAALRQQSEYYSQKVKELEAAVEKQKALYEPLESQLRDALAEVETKEQQIKLTQQDGNRWKDRAQQILQKYEVSVFLFLVGMYTNFTSELILRSSRH